MSPVTQALLAQVMATYDRSLDSTLLPEQRRSLVLEGVKQALREQDRITRHACADAVLELSLDEFGSTRVAASVMQSRASGACMNAHAI